MNCIMLMFLLLALLAIALSTASCSPKSAVKTTAAITSTPPPTSAPVTTKVTVKPKLEQASFTLTLTPPQTYSEYTLPLYLTSRNILHLMWTVSGVGEHIRMAINTPSGQYIGIKTDGGFVLLTPDQTCDQLNRSGSIILKPSEQKWVDGYYIFHTYICDEDATVNVKILYWIE